MRNQRYNLKLARPGTAMTEFALALPLLVVVLGLIWLMGWSHMRRQRVTATSRLAVWRSIEGEPLNNEELNEQGLNNRAESAETIITDMIGDRAAREAWVEEVAMIGESAAVLADTLVLQQWSGGTRMRIEAIYEAPLPIGRDFADDMAFSHGRAGREWTLPQDRTLIRSVLPGLYYPDLDANLSDAADDGSEIAARIRGLYLWNWLPDE